MRADAGMPRFMVVVAGLFGIAGISLAAAASHLDDPRLFGGAALMCLVHAPALLALALGGERLRTAYPAAALIMLGVFMFAGDLVKRHYTGSGLFPMSAPIGGISMMGGWLVAAIGGLLPRR